MAMKVLDDAADVDWSRLNVEDLIVRRVDTTGELLDASHDLLMRVFDPSVVDPKEVYVDAVTDRSGMFRDFRAVFFAALFNDGPHERLAGFISTDLMLVGTPPTKLQLAVGNIATSPRLRELGFRGVGTTLWQAALKWAEQEAKNAGKRVDYSTLEAEPASLRFWAKLGYRWPEGVKYFQPPLEFDEDGNPEHEEVPETLLIHPLGNDSGCIGVGEMKDIVQSIYWNWSIRPYVRKLSAEALARAKAYVMGRVFQKTLDSLPPKGSIRLVDVPASRVH